MTINMACVAHRYRLQKDKEIMDAFELLHSGLEEIAPRLTHRAIFAMRDVKKAAEKSGADGIRATAEELLVEVDKYPLRTAQVSENADKLRQLLFA